MKKEHQISGLHNHKKIYPYVFGAYADGGDLPNAIKEFKMKKISFEEFHKRIQRRNFKE